MADVQSVEFTINLFGRIDAFFLFEQWKVRLFVSQQRKVLLEQFCKFEIYLKKSVKLIKKW